MLTELQIMTAGYLVFLEFLSWMLPFLKFVADVFGVPYTGR